MLVFSSLCDETGHLIIALPCYLFVFPGNILFPGFVLLCGHSRLHFYRMLFVTILCIEHMILNSIPVMVYFL